MMKSINYFFILFTMIIPMIISLINNNKMIHPIIMGMALFLLTITSSMNMSMTMKNHWFSFLTFLILIGGMMILFLYFISFNNNNKMLMKSMFMMSLSLKLIFFMILMLTIYFKFNWILWIFNSMEFDNMKFNEKFNLIYMYLQKKNFPPLISMMYLLMVLSLIVKLCVNKKIKIRKINYEKIYLKKNNLMNIIYNSLIMLPTPLNISIWWNFGSLLGLCLMTQIITGLFLSMHYCPEINLAFNSVTHIIQDVNYGWMFRLIHMNGASMFFMCLFIHIGRGMYYNSFLMWKTWYSGILILLITMGAAFMGYVLPWGQMSFWGATVITNLLSAIPYLGEPMVQWLLWGGFSVNNATLNRFYSLHFILPFIVLFMVIIHLTFLHETGSSNPMGLNMNFFKIPFNPYYSIKDTLGFIIMILLLILICLLNPYILGDPENFNQANSMITPIHIQPEWYFLFAYAILRSIPNKLGGVIALIMSILILMIMLINFIHKFKGYKFYYLSQFMFWNFIMIFFMLTWAGAKPVENRFIIIGQMSSIMYFIYFIMMPLLSKFNDLIMFNKYLLN